MDYRLHMSKLWKTLTEPQRFAIAHIWDDQKDFEVSPIDGLKQGTLDKLEHMGIVDVFRVTGSKSNVARLTQYGLALAYFAHYDWWMAKEGTGISDRAYLTALRHFFFDYRRAIATGEAVKSNDIMLNFQVVYMPDACEICDISADYNDGDFDIQLVEGTSRRYILPQDIMAAVNDIGNLIRERDSWIKYLAARD